MIEYQNTTTHTEMMYHTFRGISGNDISHILIFSYNIILFRLSAKILSMVRAKIVPVNMGSKILITIKKK